MENRHIYQKGHSTYIRNVVNFAKDDRNSIAVSDTLSWTNIRTKL